MITSESPPVYRLATEDDVARAGAAATAETDPQTTAAADDPARTGRAWWRSRTLRVAAAVMAVLVGLPVTVAAVWVIHITLDAGRGADTPESTLIDWVASFQDPGAVDADRMVEPASRQRLRQVRADLLAAMAASGLSPTITTGSPPAGQSWTPAAVTGDTATWTDWYEMRWRLSADGAQSQVTDTLPWRAHAHRSPDGWRLTDVQVPPWCGLGGYVTTCGLLTGGSSSSPASAGPSNGPAGSPAPSVSPSQDLLQAPREMLPCGPRDPFPEYHHCPSSRPATPAR